MNRTIIYIIDEAHTGIQIKDYLKSLWYSSKNLITLKKQEGSVILNGTPAFLNQILKTDDELVIHINETANSEKIPPVHIPLNIIYEDEDLMVINKPSNMPIHPSLNNYYNSLANGLAWYFKNQNKPFVFRCINRLDRDTSGLTIIAKHAVSGGILSQMIAAKNPVFYENKKNNFILFPPITREYLAIVRGSLAPDQGTISAPIGRKEHSIIERIIDFEHGETAITHYKKIEEKNEHSLVSLTLETGRTHQIRVHMKHLGFPLVGDHLYNPDMEYIQRQALHAYKINFIHPITKKEMEFTAPLPPDMSFCSKETI